MCGQTPNFTLLNLPIMEEKVERFDSTSEGQAKVQMKNK